MRFDMYVLKDGTPCSMEEYVEKHRDTSYSRIALTEIEPEDKAYVSTVWLGINHAYGDGEPVIFETMAFYDGDWRECRRYSTEAEARQGHAEVVAEVMAKRFYPGARYFRALETETD